MTKKKSDLMKKKKKKEKKSIRSKDSCVLLPVLSLTDLASQSILLALVHLLVNSCSNAGYSNTEVPSWMMLSLINLYLKTDCNS